MFLLAAAESISDVLRFVVTRIVSNYYCNFRYLFIMIKDTNICASGFSGKSTCNVSPEAFTVLAKKWPILKPNLPLLSLRQGDSGGPLTVPDDDGKPTQVGITSFGIGLGCEKYWPPAFTRVTSFLDWISEVTKGGFHDTTELGPLPAAEAPQTQA